MDATETKIVDLGDDDDTDNVLTLPECFDLVFKVHQLLETGTESTSSDNIQGQLLEATKVCEKAIGMVNQLELFSHNEEIEEVSTNEIKYMLLSAYLAYLSGLNVHLPRTYALKKSKLCYTDFLKLMKSYGVIDYDVGLTEEVEEEDSEKTVRRPPPRHQDLNAMAVQRNSKIQRFREKKAMEKKLADMKVHLAKEHVDDEVKREFYLTLLKHWANLAIDEIESCNLELEMLKHREELTKRGNSHLMSSSGGSEASKSKPFRPFILTKTQLQKAVFGAGYPSIATMTVDEFYEQKLKEGTLSESVQKGHSLQDWALNPEKDAAEREKEETEKEIQVERDNPEALQRARAMDDWKDEHRRGDGNRHNKG